MPLRYFPNSDLPRLAGCGTQGESRNHLRTLGVLHPPKSEAVRATSRKAPRSQSEHGAPEKTKLERGPPAGTPPAHPGCCVCLREYAGVGIGRMQPAPPEHENYFYYEDHGGINDEIQSERREQPDHAVPRPSEHCIPYGVAWKKPVRDEIYSHADFRDHAQDRQDQYEHAMSYQADYYGPASCIAHRHAWSSFRVCASSVLFFVHNFKFALEQLRE